VEKCFTRLKATSVPIFKKTTQLTDNQLIKKYIFILIEQKASCDLQLKIIPLIIAV